MRPSVRRSPRSRSVIEPLETRQMLSVDVTVNAAQKFQQIDGFGTAVAWWKTAPYNEPGWTQMFYQDLGSSMLRLDININTLRGADDDLNTPVTMVDDLQTNINQFNFHVPLAGQNIGDIAAAALTQKLDDFKLIGSIWSPPQWMKGEEVSATTGKKNGTLPYIGGPLNMDSIGGTLIDTPGNLQQFGRYVAAYVKGFEQTYGVPFYAISIQNELAFHEGYNSCVYTPALYVKALKAVADAFHQYGITTKIQGPEDVGVGSTSDLSVLNRQMSYINAVKADPIAKADLDIYSIHGYATDGATPSRSPEMWASYWNKIKSDGLHSWMTETSGEAQTLSGALRIANNAMDALTQGNVNAWIYYLTGKDGSNGSDTLTNDTNTQTFKYSAAKQFFRYIRPGAFRVSATPSNPQGVYVGAFEHEVNQTLTTVLINDGSTAQTINLNTLGGTVGVFDVARLTDATHLFSEIGPITFANGKATFTLPAKSILTLEGTITPAVVVASSAIAGSVFGDTNANGTKDTGEKNITTGRTVWLDSDNDGQIDPAETVTTTDSGGNYFFGSLPTGTYTVRQVVPGGWRQTLPGSGTALTIKLGDNQDYLTARFGTTDRVLLSGNVFNDANGDKKKVSSEKGLSGWKVFIDLDNDGKLDSNERSASTDGSGNWSFNDILAGTYTVRVQQKTGYKATTPTGGKTSLTLLAGTTQTGLLFGEKKG